MLWFLSGIAMVYWRMPSLDPGERLRRMAPLELDRVRVAPGEAARALEAPPERVRIAMLGERPVYRLAAGGRWTAVHADDGAPAGGLTGGEAARLARRLYPEHAGTIRYDRRIAEPDQWTLQIRPLLPAHRVALGDSADTWVHLSARTAEPVMKASRAERRRAYLSAVPHWLYFTPLRRHGTLWSRLVIALSLAGCALTASGLLWGVRQALRAGSGEGRSPYAGWMRWHHYAGLAFGLFTFTWILSGLLSMEPVAWHPDRAPTLAQRERAAGGPLRLDGITVERLRRAHGALAAEVGAVKEIEIVQLGGEVFLLAYLAASSGSPPTGATAHEPTDFLAAAQPFAARLVSLARPERGVSTALSEETLTHAARAAMPDASLRDATWLETHDAYYYGRGGRAPLPVLRARFDDPAATWLYLDPRTGGIVRREQRLTRIDRWLYRGLHSLDFPFLYRHRPLWDAVVVALCLGGLLVATTSMKDGWRRVVRHLRRPRR